MATKGGFSAPWRDAMSEELTGDPALEATDALLDLTNDNVCITEVVLVHLASSRMGAH